MGKSSEVWRRNAPSYAFIGLSVWLLLFVVILGRRAEAQPPPASSGAMSAAGEHELAAKIFREHNCGSCHTLTQSSHFGYTRRGLRMKRHSLGCVDLLSHIAGAVQVPPDKWSAAQRSDVRDFKRFGCTACHEIGPMHLGLTPEGSKLVSAHMSCPEVEKVLNSKR